MKNVFEILAWKWVHATFMPSEDDLSSRDPSAECNAPML